VKLDRVSRYQIYALSSVDPLSHNQNPTVAKDLQHCNHPQESSLPLKQDASSTGFKPITEEDERIEDDIRAMDAEADHLRRSS
jgi:hypothetical protein